MSVFSRRLLAVAGKGGVGRTTVAAALALAAGARGRRVCVAELYGAWRIQHLFGARARSYAPIPIAPRVDAMSLDAVDCLDDFGRKKLKIGALVKALLHNRVMGAFLDAVPGLHDLQQLGKIENMLMEPGPGEPRYDLVVLDAPATGHSLTMLAGARAMREMTVVGPFHDLAQRIEALLDDHTRTGLVLVTLPEALPVREALELVEALGPDAPLLDAIVVNQVRPASVPAQIAGVPWETVRAALVADPNPDVQAVLATADQFVLRQHAADRALTRLTSAVRARHAAATTCSLPSVDVDQLTADDVRALARALVALGDPT
jgi:anion-transporting  ArsA/GET3 family ATPase